MRLTSLKYCPIDEELFSPTDDKKLVKLGCDLSSENISVDLFIAAENPIVGIL